MSILHLWKYNCSCVRQLDETVYVKAQKSMFSVFQDQGNKPLWNKPGTSEINFLPELPRLKSFSWSSVCLQNYVKLSS